MKKSPIRNAQHPSSLSEQFKSKDRLHRRAVNSVPAQAPQLAPRNDLTPALTLREWRIGDLKRPSRDVRTLAAGHVEEIAASMGQFGCSVPPIVDEDGNILDGVARVEAARRQGVQTIQCVEARHLTAAQKKLFRIAANRLQERGVWNFEKLKLEFNDLILEDAPLEISGFSSAEIDHILLEDEIDSEESEEAPAPDDKAPRIAALGDLFELGKHRIACGDAREADVWRRLMDNSDANWAQQAAGQPDTTECAAMVLTDEPYNVPIVGNVTTRKDHREFAVGRGEMSADEFAEFNKTWMALSLKYLRNGGILATFIDWRSLHVVTNAALQLSLSLLNLIVWAKTNAGLGSLFRSQYELLPLFKKGDAPHVNNVGLGQKAGRWRSNLWTYAGASSLGSEARKGLEDHPTTKPVTMLKDALLDLTNRDDIILDPFLGSGSTLLAAEKTGRRCFGIELDPLYVDVVIRRWEMATGRKHRRIPPSEE